MTDLDALLAGIVANPHEVVRWLIVADWLDDHGFADRAELLRLHRMLIDTCCEPNQHPERAAWQARIVGLIDQGVKPCVPQHTLMLPCGPLVGNFIPPGSCLMGTNDGPSHEQPMHRVVFSQGFFLGIHPVTQAQWSAMMGTSPSHFRGNMLPVEQVNWLDAKAFCTRASKLSGVTVRLPTEAEWEYACRAGTTTHFHWGDAPDTGRMNYDGAQTWNGSAEGESRQDTTAVGSFATNPWGLSDMHGNVWEWCSDWYDRGFYSRSPEEAPECWYGERTHRVVRGGSWISSPDCCRAAYRYDCRPTRGGHGSGFRIAFTLD